jgi:hypothetical protein
MLRRLIEARAVTCYCVAALVWTAGWFLMPFRESHPLLVYIHFKEPTVYQVFYWSYLAMWFTTPWFLTSLLLSLLYISIGRRDPDGQGGRLPPYPDPAVSTPLENDLEAYALAYGIASLLNTLYGRGKEPFWQQAHTILLKFVILLHKVPIVARECISSLPSTLPGESWRALLQILRTKISLSPSDDFSTRVASDVCGEEEQL